MTVARIPVTITARAQLDLQRIAAYYAATYSPDRALAVIDAISAKIATLDQFPERGAVPVEVRNLGIEDFRQVIVLPFRIFYLIDADSVSVMLIADGRRDIGSLLQQRMIHS